MKVHTFAQNFQRKKVCDIHYTGLRMNCNVDDTNECMGCTTETELARATQVSRCQMEMNVRKFLELNQETVDLRRVWNI